MRAWCPRCDAVRPGETTCPACGTPLATLQEPPPASAPDAPDTPADTGQPAPPPSAPSRLRVALAVTVVVLGGLAFVAGRSGARPAPPAAPATTTPPATTAPAAGDDLRELGWRSSPRRGITITAVSIGRLVTPDRETSALLTLRVEGLPPGQRLFAFRGLRLLDVGGGVFSAPEEEPIGDQVGMPVEPTRDPDTYMVLTAPAPRLQTLARVEVDGLIVVRPPTATIGVDVGGPWPARPPLRAADQGSRDRLTVTVPGGSLADKDLQLPVRLAAVLVGGGRAVVALDVREVSGALEAFPGGGTLPLGAELRAGGRVLCSRTLLLRGGEVRSGSGMVLACRTRPVARLEVAVGAGVQRLRVGATLKP
jgi:hypothetical protein